MGSESSLTGVDSPRLSLFDETEVVKIDTVLSTRLQAISESKRIWSQFFFENFLQVNADTVQCTLLGEHVPLLLLGSRDLF